MKRLIIGRHGGATRMAGLTEAGRQQVVQLAKALPPHTVGSVTILSSVSKRGEQSTGILLETLGCSATYHDLLYDDRLHPGGNFDEIAELVRQNMDGVDTLIIMGHLNHGRWLAEHLCFALFQFKVDMSGIYVGYGNACVVDLETKSYKGI